MRASGPTAASASRGPSRRTSVSASPRRAGPVNVAPTTASILRLRTIGNRCGAEGFEPDVVDGQCGARAQVSRGDDDVDAVVVGIGAQRRYGGEHDQRARGDPTGGHRARPVRPQHLGEPMQRRRD